MTKSRAMIAITFLTEKKEKIPLKAKAETTPSMAVMIKTNSMGEMITTPSKDKEAKILLKGMMVMTPSTVVPVKSSSKEEMTTTPFMVAMIKTNCMETKATIPS